MKNFLSFLFAWGVLLMVGCSDSYDDSTLVNRMDSLENRVAKLEELCKQMNTNISSLQSIITAIQRNDYITNVTPVVKDGETIGYTISFTKSQPITIYHGQDGKDGDDGKDGVNGEDGYTPQIGVKQDTDGIYYWTVDGEWLLDSNGNKIKAQGTDGKDGQDGANGADGNNGADGQPGTSGADGEDGITPELKIEDGKWYVSYDNGSTWVELGQATGEQGPQGPQGDPGVGGDSMFTNIDYSNENYVLFTLSNGTQIQVPTWYAFEQLQTLCNQMNTNITALQTIVTALQTNDYVQSITPLMENGKEIGYTITFSKSGTVTIYHGKDGQNGQNGTNGADGADGHTPQIGVKQDTDGIYYWTIDGEWLLDSNGNKIKAQGTDGKDGQDGANGADGNNGADGQPGTSGADGKDGITPQLKIEEGYWYISYDNGQTWTQLGKATGEDGADGTNGTNGKDGDSFFQSVTQDENNVYLTLSDGTKITIPLASSYLFNRLQSVTYIPKYSDGKAYVEDGVAEFDFQISPKDAVAEIAAKWETILSMKAVYTITRAVSFVDMPILSCTADEANGVISITVSDKNLSEEFFIGTQEASAALQISDGNNNIASDYTIIAPYHPYNEIWYTSKDGSVITPKVLTVFGGLNIISNTYENGKGIIKFDGVLTELNDCQSSTTYIPFHGSNITSITLSPKLTKIGDRFFYGCEYLTSVIIPKNVVSIGEYALQNCPLLTSIYCMALIPPAIWYTGPQVYKGSFPKNSNMKIYVPRSAYDRYVSYTTTSNNEIAQTNWSVYTSYIESYDF